MPGSPEQIGVAKRRNCKDMMRSMMCRSNILEYLWGEAIKIVNYILNRVPNKSVPKTLFELWTSRKCDTPILGVSLTTPQPTETGGCRVT